MTTDEKIQAAYDTLTAGRPSASDGQLTVSNICTEAGISRASFYRSPLAARIRADLTDPASTRRPEAEQLRVKVRSLTAADKELRSKHAAEIRDLRAPRASTPTRSRSSLCGSAILKTTTSSSPPGSSRQATTSPR